MRERFFFILHPSSLILRSLVKRRLLNVLTLASLLLCAAATALWVRSRMLRHHDEVSWDGRRSGGSLISAGGELFLHHVTWDRRWWTGGPMLSYSHEAEVLGFTPAPPPRWLGPGLGLLRRHAVSRSAGSSLGIGYLETWVVVPAWLAAAAGAALPLAWAYRRFRAARRLRPGQCRVCGYDLRATPDKCPECETEPAMATFQFTVPLRRS